MDEKQKRFSRSFFGYFKLQKKKINIAFSICRVQSTRLFLNFYIRNFAHKWKIWKKKCTENRKNCWTYEEKIYICWRNSLGPAIAPRPLIRKSVWKSFCRRVYRVELYNSENISETNSLTDTNYFVLNVPFYTVRVLG